MSYKGKLRFSTILGSFFGIGFAPFAPGTFGSLAALGLYYLMPAVWFEFWNLPWYLLALLVFSLFSVPIATQAEKILGHDAPAIVIDEVCGFFLAVAFLPKTWLVGLYGFVLFRVFDIAKPFPVNRAQKLPAGWGIVVDDLVAGLYALILLQLLHMIYPRFFGI